MGRFVGSMAAALVIGALGSSVARAHDHMGHDHLGHDHLDHAGTARATDTAATREFRSAHDGMMAGMSRPYTGDADVDFRLQMIPHHQGAIEMAKVAMRHAKDPWSRQLAESIIVEQQREIAEMQAWLARHGAAVPPGGQPRHIMKADSYRSLQPEPGTQAEAAGRSWAPGAGIR